tara:strand:+ start:1380 stop:1667 length:288 start_codon:yes stop_codon:yes gene_type:complete
VLLVALLAEERLVLEVLARHQVLLELQQLMLAVAVAVQGLTERLVRVVLEAEVQALILEQYQQQMPQLTLVAAVVAVALNNLLQIVQVETAALAS